MAGTYGDTALLRNTGSIVGRDPAAPQAAARVPITVLEPEGRARGGIVLLHESPEFTAVLLGSMQALASEGWTVVTPDLFSRATEPGRGVFGEELLADFDACFDWLTNRGIVADCIGVLGFDTAGTAAFLVAAHRPVGAAVSVSARGIDRPVAEQAEALLAAAPHLQTPWLGLFSADSRTPDNLLELLREQAAKAAVASLIIDGPDIFEAEPADSHTRIFDWFDNHLR